VVGSCRRRSGVEREEEEVDREVEQPASEGRTRRFCGLFLGTKTRRWLVVVGRKSEVVVVVVLTGDEEEEEKKRLSASCSSA